MPKRYTALFLAFLLGLFVLTGCGSDSDPEPAQDSGGSEKSTQVPTSDADPVILDSNGSEFNPSKVYAETIDGVVSIRAIFGDVEKDLASASVAGGSGFVLGSVLGVLVLGLIQTIITFEGTLSSWWTKIVIGALLLIFVVLQRLLVVRRR